MRIKNEEIYKFIADLWNAEACATDAREKEWCAESVQAEVRASGMTPYEALRGAVSTVCTQYVDLAHPRFSYAWDDATDDDDEEYDDDDDEGEYAADDDDDVVVEED
jgi:hypothetical protein